MFTLGSWARSARIRFLLGANVNAPFYQVSTPENSDSMSVPSTRSRPCIRVLKWATVPCVHAFWFCGRYSGTNARVPSMNITLYVRFVHSWPQEALPCLRDFHSVTSYLRFPLVALYLFTWYQHKIWYRSESYRCEFTQVTVQERDFYSGSKTHSDVMSRLYICSFRYEITLLGVMERVAHAKSSTCNPRWRHNRKFVYLKHTSAGVKCLHVNTIWNYNVILVWKLAQVRVFTCKQPLCTNRDSVNLAQYHRNELFSIRFIWMLITHKWEHGCHSSGKGKRSWVFTCQKTI